MDYALLLLKQLHELSNGSTDYEANFNLLAANMNLGCIERDNAFRSLLNKKYILNSGMGYGCSITVEGIAVATSMPTKQTKRSIMPHINIRVSDYFRALVMPKAQSIGL